MGEILACVSEHTRRSLLVVLAVALAVAGVIGVVGLSQTASARVASRFELESGTHVRISSRGGELPVDAVDRVRRLNGVVDAARYAPRGTLPVSAHGPASSPAVDAQRAALAAISPGFVAVSRAEVLEGRDPAGLEHLVGPPLAVIGARLADELRLAPISSRPVVFAGDEAHTVVAVVRGGVSVDVDRALLTLAGDAPGNPTERDELLIETELGAVRQVMEEAPVVLSPTDPSALVAEAPRPSESLRSDIEGDLGAMTFALAALFPVAAGFAIANVLLGAVLERTPEIGLKRSLGARRVDIVRQIVGENALLSVAGVGGGVGVGLAFLALVCHWQGWPLHYHPMLLVASPLVGVGTAVLSALVPAMKAARLDPATALRAT